MTVPLLDMSRQHAPLEAEFFAAWERVYRSGQYIMGPDVTALEAEVAAYVGVPHAIGLSSGTDALLLALMALEIGPGDEVLCPAFTFFGTAGSIARVGATPVWVDVLPDTYNIDLNDAARKTGPKTKAIMPVHLFGQACDMEAMMAFAEAHHLSVIEDAAQSIGARFQERQVGAWGDFGAFSFYPTKNLGAFGDAGLLTTRSPELAERTVWLRNHGMHPKYYHKYIGGNFRLDSLQAALLRVKLPHLESYHEARAAHAERYGNELKGHHSICLPFIRPEARSVWNQFTIRVLDGKRDQLRSHLQQRGIGNEVYYPLSLDRQECFAGIGRGAESIHVAHQLAAEVLSIPVFPELTEAEQSEVIDALLAFK